MIPAGRLIQAGVAGALVFAAIFTIVGTTRVAYDPVRHFVSILSLGDGGWVQVANFVVCGLLIAGLGVGLGRRWHSGPDAQTIPRLVTIAGAAVAACGIFLPDPSLGYPPGTPDQLITPLTWHGALHYASATVITAALTGAVLLAIRRGLTLGLRGLTAVSLGVAVVAIVGCGAALLFSGRQPTEIVGLMERIGIYAGWAWLALVGLLELRVNQAAAG